MTEKTLTTENIKPALDALRGELAPWPVVAKKQDRLNTAQLNAANSGITSSLVAQIIANTAAIRALESAITGTGLRALVVSSLPAIGTQGILYIVPVTTYDQDTDADVVNYSNEYIWIPVEGGQASEGHYEQVGQTGIVINNGQLTITVNGTSVGTFTANQSGDTTAAITVPTNADYVDRTTDQTVAGVKTFSSTINGTASKAIADEDGTSIKNGYVNVAGNQTVTGDKSFTGSNTFNNILPNATNTYSLGSSSYQWASVYAQTYYYNGTAWGLDKANVWSANQTINKHGSSIIFKSDDVEKGTIQHTDSSAIIFADKNNKNLCYIRQSVNGASRTIINLHVENTYKNGALSTDSDANLIQSSWIFGQLWDGRSYYEFSGGSYGDIYPLNVNGVNSNLGTSTNKWKSLNGINPGALSLPSRAYNDSIALDTTDWDYAGNGFIISMADNNGDYIPGWVVIVAEDVGDVSDFIKIRLTSYTRSPGLDFTTFYTGSQYNIKACFSTAGIGYLVLKLTNGASCIKYARYYPCLGNV